MTEKCIGYEKVKQEYFDKYFEKLSLIEEPTTKVLTIHLYTEFWINKLIDLSSPKPQEILNRNLNFSIKLILIYNMGLIPEQLYLNIKKLNKLRNKYAHNLDYEFTKSDLNYVYSNGKNISKYIQNETTRRIFMFIGAATFEWLATYVMENYMMI